LILKISTFLKYNIINVEVAKVLWYMNPQLVILKIKELASTPNHGFKKKFKLVKGLVFETLDFS
jgi:hypothetical protein